MKNWVSGMVSFFLLLIISNMFCISQPITPFVHSYNNMYTFSSSSKARSKQQMFLCFARPCSFISDSILIKLDDTFCLALGFSSSFLGIIFKANFFLSQVRSATKHSANPPELRCTNLCLVSIALSIRGNGWTHRPAGCVLSRSFSAPEYKLYKVA